MNRIEQYRKEATILRELSSCVYHNDPKLNNLCENLHAIANREANRLELLADEIELKESVALLHDTNTDPVS